MVGGGTYGHVLPAGVRVVVVVVVTTPDGGQDVPVVGQYVAVVVMTPGGGQDAPEFEQLVIIVVPGGPLAQVVGVKVVVVVVGAGQALWPWKIVVVDGVHDPGTG